uniref:Uncharacterized protein n=1 Tax=Myoviridae sp. ctkfK18 TaxID=2825165 RepID=A0A8S5VGT3_9CAUD|nr:MAG TPA: hypothetical protein [Myoviridae sp. ctkfK18]
MCCCIGYPILLFSIGRNWTMMSGFSQKILKIFNSNM